MVIVDYVASLLPSVHRSRIEEDLRILKEELIGSTLPPLEQAERYFDEVKLISKETLEFDRMFQREVQPKRKFSGHYISATRKILENSQTFIPLLEESITRSFAEKNASAVITYSKANQLRLVEILYFVYRYARKLMLWTVYQEIPKASSLYGRPLNDPEIAWLFTRRRAFFKAMSVLQLKPEEVKHRLAIIPDLDVIPEEALIAEQTQSMQKLDAFTTNLIPIQLNPIYHLRIAVVEFQAARHQVATEECRLLEYRLLAMKDARNGKNDAKLEQQIEYTENRLKKLKYKLKQFEEDVE